MNYCPDCKHPLAACGCGEPFNSLWRAGLDAHVRSKEVAALRDKVVEAATDHRKATLAYGAFVEREESKLENEEEYYSDEAFYAERDRLLDAMDATEVIEMGAIDALLAAEGAAPSPEQP